MKLFQDTQRLTKERGEYECEAAQIRSEKMTIEAREKRVLQEKRVLEEQCEFTAGELTKCNELSRTQQKAASKRIFELQTELDEKSEQAQSALAANETLREQTTVLEARVQQLSGEVETGETQRLAEKAISDQEIGTKSKLNDLYKSEREGLKAKVSEAARSVETLNDRLSQELLARSDEKAALESRMEDAEARHQQDQGLLEKTKRELERANDLLEANTQGDLENSLSQQFPTASAASKLIPAGGMGLIQIYEQLEEKEKALLLQRAEVRRLESYLQQILEEIEAKSPEIQRLREEHGSQAEHIYLLKQSNEELQRERCNAPFLKRERDRLEMRTNDQDHQLRHLIRENAILRGDKVDAEDAGSAGSAMTAGEVISESLVTFGSIAELQKQNQDLLTAFRELSSGLESEEQITHQQELQAIKEQLEGEVDNDNADCPGRKPPF